MHSSTHLTLPRLASTQKTTIACPLHDTGITRPQMGLRATRASMSSARNALVVIDLTVPMRASQASFEVPVRAPRTLASPERESHRGARGGIAGAPRASGRFVPTLRTEIASPRSGACGAVSPLARCPMRDGRRKQLLQRQVAFGRFGSKLSSGGRQDHFERGSSICRNAAIFSCVQVAADIVNLIDKSVLG